MVLDKMVGELIQEIAPLNNAYRSAVRSGSTDGARVLEIMWDVGEVLLRAGVERVEPVAWEMYGRTRETRRSFITRSFTVYCYRVRRYFPGRDDIRRQFPGLRRYSLFRDALPLLDNRRYAVGGEEKKALLALLNSDDPRNIRAEVARIKRERIGLSGARSGRRAGLEGAAGAIMSRHQELLEIIAARDARKLKAVRRRLGDENLLVLSRYCLSLFSEEFPVPEDTGGDPAFKGAWGDFYDALSATVAGGPAMRNRMRRVVRPVVFMELAEMLSAARTGTFVEHDFQ